MADLALYENFLEHARVMESILNRRRSAALRKMELGFEMPDAEFVGLFRLNKGLCRDLIQELEPYLPTRRGGISTVSKVCDSDLTITSIDASNGGANHDAFVWNHHPLKPHLEDLHQEENETLWFLGDSGYPLRPTLMTPIVNTEPDSPQRYYTDLHCRTGNVVERCIGVLKSRWRCLLVDRKLHYHPTTAGLITNACVVLHNICNVARLPVPPLTSQEEQREITMQIRSEAARRYEHLAAGESVRNALVARLWSAR